MFKSVIVDINSTCNNLEKLSFQWWIGIMKRFYSPPISWVYLMYWCFYDSLKIEKTRFQSSITTSIDAPVFLHLTCRRLRWYRSYMQSLKRIGDEKQKTKRVKPSWRDQYNTHRLETKRETCATMKAIDWCLKNVKKCKNETTAPGIPVWSPTTVLTEPSLA